MLSWRCLQTSESVGCCSMVTDKRVNYISEEISTVSSVNIVPGLNSRDVCLDQGM